MARPCTFTQYDVLRALRAADKAGCPVRRVEIGRDGTIVLVLEQDREGEAIPSDRTQPAQPAIKL